MFKNYQIFTKSGIVFFVILFFSVSLKSNTIDNLKNQFIALGGSIEGFNKIIQVVQKSQGSSAQLKDKITQNYNKTMFEIMVASVFDPKAYTQVYNNLEQEKSQLVTQNLNDMISLLGSLSLKDRQAYAQLLYGVNNTVPNAPGEVMKDNNASKDNNNNSNTNDSNNNNANN